MSRGIKRPLSVAFPARLKKARIHAWLSALALSEAAGLGGGTVALLEAGDRVPRLGTVARLAQALGGVSAGQLAFGDPRAPVGEPDVAGLAARLRATREALGLTPYALGVASKTSYAQVQTIESGSDPTIEVVDRIAAALKIRSSWLAFGRGERQLSRRGRRPAAESPVESPVESPAL